MEKNEGAEADNRRNFLKTCGRFAAVVPPAMTILLSTSLTSEAIAKSASGGGGGMSGGGGSPSSGEVRTKPRIEPIPRAHPERKAP